MPAKRYLANWVRVVFAAVCCAAIVSVAAIAAEPADLIPDSAIATLTIRDGAKQVAALREAALFKKYLVSEAYEALQLEPQYVKAQGGLYLFAGTVGTDPWTLAAQTLGKELTIALLPGEKPDKPHVIAALVPDDAKAAERIVDVLLTMSGSRLDGKPVADRHKVVDGVTGYKINDEAFVATVDGVVVFSNHADTLEQLVLKRAEKTGKLAASSEYKRAVEAAPAGAVAVATVNLKVIRTAAGEAWNKKADNFVGAMLASGWLENIRKADAAVAWVNADAKSISIGGRTFGGTPDAAVLEPFVVANGDAKDWSKFQIPGLIGQMELSRNWPAFWDLREKLLDPDGVRGAAEFAGGITTLMGAFDFAGEFLPALNPTVRFIAARREFKAPAPLPELPAFALVFHLKDAEKLKGRLDSGALSALSILNVDAGQKMRPQWRLSVEDHAGVKISVGRYPTNLDPGPPGMIYNFEPSVAVVGDQFVVATSLQMVKDFIDGFNKMPTAAVRAKEASPDVLNANLHELYRVFDANREALVTNRMLEKDMDRAAATRDVRLFLDAAKLLSDFNLAMKPARDGLTVSLKLGFAD